MTANKEMLIAIKNIQIDKTFVPSLCSFLDGFEFSHEPLHKAYMYPNGKLFVFFPHFKKQKIFIHAIFKKYDNITDIEEVLITDHLVSIYDFIYNPSNIPLYSILKDVNLKNMPNSYDILKEAAILANSSILDIPQHPYSNKIKDFKEKYLEFLIYYLCLSRELTAMQLAVIEKTAIDFSVSSFQAKEYFEKYLFNAQADTQEKLKSFLNIFSSEEKAQIKNDLLLLGKFKNKNLKTDLFNDRTIEKYLGPQLFISTKKEKNKLLEYHIKTESKNNN